MKKLAAAVVCALLALGSRAQADEAQLCAIAFEDGQTYAASGKLLVARETLAACAKPECPQQVRVDCLAKREQVERALPTVTFVVRDGAGKDVENPALMVDGKPISTPPGRSVAIDPGFHVVTFGRSGSDANEVKITINEGEKSRVIVLAPPTKAVVVPPVDRPRPPPPPPESKGRGPGPYVAMVGGGIVLVGAVVLQILALEVNGEAKDINARRLGTLSNGTAVDCSKSQYSSTVINGSTCRDLNDSYDRKRSSATDDQTIALVAGGIGLVAVGAGITWYFLSAPEKEKAHAFITPMLGPGVAGLRAAGTF